MNNSKSLINVSSINKKTKFSKSLQNFNLVQEKLVKELKNKEKKDTYQNLNDYEVEIDVSEIKLNN